jgi:hypothetical protein
LFLLTAFVAVGFLVGPPIVREVVAPIPADARHLIHFYGKVSTRFANEAESKTAVEKAASKEHCAAQQASLDGPATHW